MRKIMLNQLIRNKNSSNDLIDNIIKSFIDLTKNTIEDTIKNTSNEQIKIRDLRETDKWLGVALNSVFNAAKYISSSNNILNNIIKPDKKGDFQIAFEDTLVSIKYNQTKEIGTDKNIKTTVKIVPTVVGAEANLIANVLNAAYYGGEIKGTKDTTFKEDETFIVNSNPGYNQSEINKAVLKLRDFFYNQHKDEISKKFEKEIDNLIKEL